MKCQVVCGSKVVILEEDKDVGVGVRKTGTRGEGVDRWMVRGVYRAEVRGVSLSKPQGCQGSLESE